MKSLKLILATVFAVAAVNHAFAECKDNEGHYKVAGMADDGHKAVVTVSGMTCDACVDKLKSEVAKIKLPTAGVSIVVEKNLVTIDYSKAKIEPKQLEQLKTEVKAAVTKSSFQVSEEKHEKKS